MQAFWLFLMMISVGYASHVASLSFWSGFLSHTLHFIFVTLWVGTLLQVAWFTKESKNWTRFLHWFTPFAIVCLLFIVTSGIMIMFFVVEPKDYVNAWAIPYGQMLLLKHLSIIPVLIFAFINGLLAKKSSLTSSFLQQRWVKAESIILLVVFFFTGVMGTLSPPHTVNDTVKAEGAASWAEALMGKHIEAPFQIEFVLSLEGISLILIACAFLALLIGCFFKKVTPIVSVCLGFLFIFSMYLGLMWSVSIVD
ncbi:copper resistance D family protein [Fictibacillus sp. NRS-1165]|uniref:copper resistance D family protein n=1 Tax=Fictibacillus sp. NRS-1165 TaxID=3144463 RepID=UPI003D21271D